MCRRGLWLRVLAVFAALLFLLPVLFIFGASFLSRWETDRLFAGMGRYTDEGFLPSPLPPMEATLEQYRELLLERPQVPATLLNSAGYVLLALLGMLLAAPAAAFAFALLKFKGRDALFLVYVFVLLLPFQVLCVPVYLSMDALRLLDTPWALILPEVFSPLPVFFLRQFMKGIPASVLEAARIDGAGWLRCYGSVVLPLCRPALAAACVLVSAKMWNLIEQPLLLLQTRRLYPLSLYIHEMMDARQFGLFAVCVLALVPILLLFLAFSDETMDGIDRMEL